MLATPSYWTRPRVRGIPRWWVYQFPFVFLISIAIIAFKLDNVCRKQPISRKNNSNWKHRLVGNEHIENGVSFFTNDCFNMSSHSCNMVRLWKRIIQLYSITNIRFCSARQGISIFWSAQSEGPRLVYYHLFGVSDRQIWESVFVIIGWPEPWPLNIGYY